MRFDQPGEAGLYRPGKRFALPAVSLSGLRKLAKGQKGIIDSYAPASGLADPLRVILYTDTIPDGQALAGLLGLGHREKLIFTRNTTSAGRGRGLQFQNHMLFVIATPMGVKDVHADRLAPCFTRGVMVVKADWC